MQIVATMKKLLNRYTTWEVLTHFANELDQCAAHYETVGAPRRAAYLRKEAEAFRECAAKISKIEY